MVAPLPVSVPSDAIELKVILVGGHRHCVVPEMEPGKNTRLFIANLNTLQIVDAESM